MNYINCIIRLLEIPQIKLYDNKVLLTQFNVEVARIRSCQNKTIIKAIIWGDLAYTINKYYKINDYLLIEGYILTESVKTLNFKITPKLAIFQIYPFLSIIESN